MVGSAATSARIAIVLINFGVGGTLAITHVLCLIHPHMMVHIEGQWLKHVLHVFEFFGLKGRIDPVYHVVISLLLLLLHLRELLEVFL